MADSLDELQVPIADLKHYKRNARVGNVDVIAESLTVNGQYRPIVVNRRTSEVLAGNHTLKAARQLGWETIAATFVDVDDEAAARIVLVDNRSNDLAGYDDKALVEVLRMVEDDLAGTGFTQADLDALLADVEQPPVIDDPDDVPDIPEQPRSVLGDVWILGAHRLTCGDSTDPESWKRLMDGTADLLVTDPPYGVDYQGRIGASPVAGWSKQQHDAYSARRRKDGLKVSNDALGEEGTRQLVADAISIVPLKRGGVFYVFSPPGDMELAFRLGLTDAGMPMRHSIVWVKDQFTFGRSDYHYRHESILYGWKAGGAHYFVDDRTQDSVWECPRPRRSKEHPTMKPVELVARAVQNSSKPKQIVVDPFGGSGTTLIAAHTTGRVARLIELDPAYVDVICRRFQEATGEKPVLEATGEPHDFTKAT